MTTSISIDDKVTAFLKDYKTETTQLRVASRVNYAITYCEALLSELNIKCIVNGRAKKYESLEKKTRDLVREDKEFQDWIKAKKEIQEFPEMGDLAGVRIGVYFPDDIISVVEALNRTLKDSHSFGSVTGGRKASAARNLDVHKHGDGPWRDGEGVSWEHSGYKSWQQVFLLEPDRDGPHGKRFQAEIQVGTSVMQSWAEVQHNIIYKNSEDILATPAMQRMIDAVNGLAITTEIILRELQRNLQVAKKEAKELAERPFENGAELFSFFVSSFASQLTSDNLSRMARHTVANDVLLQQCTADPRSGRGLCRADLRGLVSEKAVSQAISLLPPGAFFEIDSFIAEKLGYQWIVGARGGSWQVKDLSQLGRPLVKPIPHAGYKPPAPKTTKLDLSKRR